MIITFEKGKIYKIVHTDITPYSRMNDFIPTRNFILFSPTETLSIDTDCGYDHIPCSFLITFCEELKINGTTSFPRRLGSLTEIDDEDIKSLIKLTKNTNIFLKLPFILKHMGYIYNRKNGKLWKNT